MDLSKISDSDLESFIEVGEGILGKDNYYTLKVEKENRAFNKVANTINTIIDSLNQTSNPYKRLDYLTQIHDLIKTNQLKSNDFKSLEREYDFLTEMNEQKCLNIYDEPTKESLKRAYYIYEEFNMDTSEILEAHRILKYNSNIDILNANIHSINQFIENQEYDKAISEASALIHKIDNTNVDYLQESEQYQMLLKMVSEERSTEDSIISKFNEVVSRL